jgi:hypothetical protein
MNFWSLLKRGLSGTYISVEPFHPFRYIDEPLKLGSRARVEAGVDGQFNPGTSEQRNRDDRLGPKSRFFGARSAGVLSIRQLFNSAT